MTNVRKQKRKSEEIWPAEAMREETRRALHGEPKEDEESEEAETEIKEERPFFPDYDTDKVRGAFRAAKADGKEIPLHDPKIRYTAKDIGRVIMVAEKVGLEGRMGYIAGVVEKVDAESGRLYVLVKKGDKLDKERCWFYAK